MDYKRDMDLIRLILLDIEGEELVDLSPYSTTTIGYHKYLLTVGGLVKGNFDITQKGHNFLDEARDEAIWEKVKKALAEKGITVSFADLRVMLQKEIEEGED